MERVTAASPLRRASPPRPGVIAITWRRLEGDARAAKQAARELCVAIYGSLDPTGFYVSRTGTAGLAGVAACRDWPVGLDAEAERADLVDDDLLDLALHPTERASIPADPSRAFAALWSRKEAVLKALGVGLAIPPSTVHVGWRADTWQVIQAGGRRVSLISLPAPNPAGAAVAVLGAAPPVRVSIH